MISLQMKKDPKKLRVAGVILAAGGSKRLGQPKQGLSWHGGLFALQIALQGLAAGLDPLICVIGAAQELIRDSVGNLPVKLIENPNWEKGQSTSMHVGLLSLPLDCDGVVFMLGDQPQVTAVLIRKLIEKREQICAPIIAPRVGNRRGNPVLFGREAFEALNAVKGDKAGREIFDQFDIAYVPWIDKRIFLDVDITKDIIRMNQMFGDVIE